MIDRRPRAATIGALGRRAVDAFLHGTWVPGRHNVALLVIQLAGLYQASLRGRDYLIPRTPEQIAAQGLDVVALAGPLPLWGWLFYGSSAVVLFGLAGRWAPIVIAGHALLCAWYIGVGFGILMERGVTITGSLLGGAALATGGTVIVFRRRASNLGVRLLVGVPAMLAGQELMSLGLGQDYRSGTGLIGAGVIHATIAAGTWLLARRERLRLQVEEELGVRIPR